MSRAYYSLIQYCPDLSRSEALNVGLVLLRPEAAEVRVRALQEVPALGTVFGLGKGEMQSALRAIRSMEARITRERFAAIEEYEHFVATRGNEVQLTRPRSMNADQDLVEAMERMFDELVLRPKLPRASGSRPRRHKLLDTLFKELQRSHPSRAELRPRFVVPELGTEYRADYGFLNGHRNLVKTERIPTNLERATELALGTQRIGQLITRADGPAPDAEWIIVGLATSAEQQKAEERFASVIDTQSERVGSDRVRFVRSTEVSAFARQVELDVLERDSGAR